jgi:hypothetical protein
MINRFLHTFSIDFSVAAADGLAVRTWLPDCQRVSDDSAVRLSNPVYDARQTLPRGRCIRSPFHCFFDQLYRNFSLTLHGAAMQ